MALHTLKIVVVNGGRASGYSASGGSGSSSTSSNKQKIDKDDPLYKLFNAKKLIQEKIKSKLTPATAYSVSTFGRLAMQTAKSAFSYYISDIGRSTGDSNYQARVNRAFEVGSQVMSLISNTMGGASAGFMTSGGNPLGAIIGAAVGLTSSVMSIGFQNAEKERAYRHTMAEEKAGIDYTIGRMTGATGVRVR